DQLARIDRQLADTLAGQLEQCVGERRDDRRQRRFAHSGRRIVRLDEFDVNPRRRGHPRDLILVEVRRLGPPVLDLDGEADRLAETVDDRTFHLVQRTERVDDVAAYITCRPDIVNLYLA